MRVHSFGQQDRLPTRGVVALSGREKDICLQRRQETRVALLDYGWVTQTVCFLASVRKGPPQVLMWGSKISFSESADLQNMNNVD